MRGILFIAAILPLLPAARAETALDAVKQLPPDQAARVARIEGRDGNPQPDRWYILTQDPAAGNGVHEYVVVSGEIVASRSISQFADTLKPGDILGPVPLAIDSDKAAKLAHAYAEANGLTVATINYELKKDGPDAAPAWTISCLDSNGAKLGVIVVTAGKGNVIFHDGFPIDPKPPATPAPTPKKKKPDIATTAADTPPVTDDTPAPSPAKKPPGLIGKTLDTVGHTLQKLDPF